MEEKLKKAVRKYEKDYGIQKNVFWLYSYIQIRKFLQQNMAATEDRIKEFLNGQLICMFSDSEYIRGKLNFANPAAKRMVEVCQIYSK